MIALGIPHAPWVIARRASLVRLLAELAPLCPADTVSRLFAEREGNKKWSARMWAWGAASGADFFLTLQDDVIVPWCFWPALAAMLVHLPDRAVLGLANLHTEAPDLARMGWPWVPTISYVVGWAYGMRTADLREFVRWTKKNPRHVRALHEDQLVNRWVKDTGRATWHPIPTIAQHDLSLESTYGNDAQPVRWSTETWERYTALELTSPDFWRHVERKRA